MSNRLLMAGAHMSARALATVANQTAAFGALTLAGAGGFQIVDSNGDALTGVSDAGTGTASGYSLSTAGIITPSTDGSLSAEDGNTIDFTSDQGSATVTLSIVVSDYRTLADQAEIEAAAADAPLSSTRTITVRDGTATGARVALGGLVFTGRLTVQGETNRGATLPGVDLATSENITLSALTFQRDWTASDTSLSAVLEVNGSDGLTISDNEVSSTPLTEITIEADPETLTLVGTSDTSADNLTVEDNTMHDGKFPLRNVDSDGVTFQRNDMTDFTASFGELQGSNWVYRDNKGLGLWSEFGTDPGQPKSALFGTGASVAQSNHTFIGNRLLLGTRRADLGDGVQATATGAKWNDTASDAILFDGITCRYNVLECNSNLALEIGFCTNSNFEHNTIVQAVDTDVGGNPGIFFSNVGTGVTCAHTVATTLGELAAGNVDASFFDNSHQNIIARAPGQGSTVAGDALEYSQLFDGPDFTGLTPDNVLTILAPKTGGRLLSDAVSVGAVGTYYNFETNTANDPTWTKPKTTTATGAATSRVIFDGTNDYTRVTDSTDPILGLTNSDEFTVIFGMTLDAAADGQDVWLLQSVGASMEVRHLPGNNLRIRMEDAGGATIVSADTSLSFTSADGFTIWAISVKFSTYEFYVMKGPILDPFVDVSVFTGDPHDTGRNTLAFMGTNAGGNLTAATVEFLYVGDEHINLHTVANLDNIVALDDLRPAYGADGSTVTGTAPEAYLTGVAADWNDAAGLNLGSDDAVFEMTGAVVDA